MATTRMASTTTSMATSADVTATHPPHMATTRPTGMAAIETTAHVANVRSRATTEPTAHVTNVGSRAPTKSATHVRSGCETTASMGDRDMITAGRTTEIVVNARINVRNCIVSPMETVLRGTGSGIATGMWLCSR